jgi:hypothetical protein
MVFIEELTILLFVYIVFKMSTFSIYAQLKYIFGIAQLFLQSSTHSILHSVLHILIDICKILRIYLNFFFIHYL